MFGAQSPRVMMSAPAFGTSVGRPASRAIFAMAMATPECTVPMSTSTFSERTSLFVSSVAFVGSDSSSILTKSILRPASVPPCCSI